MGQDHYGNICNYQASSAQRAADSGKQSQALDLSTIFLIPQTFCRYWRRLAAHAARFAADLEAVGGQRCCARSIPGLTGPTTDPGNPEPVARQRRRATVPYSLPLTMMPTQRGVAGV
jgi:hypothetical protein